VTLTAVVDSGSIFTGWSGGGCSGTGTCVVSLNADTSVTASFDIGVTLAVTKSGNGTGGVTSTPTGIDCGNTCSYDFAVNTSVTLTAKADPSSVFLGWTGGGCGGTGTCAIILTGQTSVDASFRTHAVWDKNWSLAGVTYSNGDLSISGNSAGVKNVRTTIGKSSGKYYWEITATGGDGTSDAGGIGIAEAAMPNSAQYLGGAPSSLGFGYGACCFNAYYVSWNGVITPSGQPPQGSAINNGLVYMFALDMGTGRFWAGQGGAWYNNGNPGGGVAPAAAGINGTVYPAVTFYASSINSFTANFGDTPMKFAVPQGFTSGFY
jgi:hypothetical protein